MYHLFLILINACVPFNRPSLCQPSHHTLRHIPPCINLHLHLRFTAIVVIIFNHRCTHPYDIMTPTIVVELIIIWCTPFLECHQPPHTINQHLRAPIIVCRYAVITLHCGAPSIRLALINTTNFYFFSPTTSKLTSNHLLILPTIFYVIL